MQTPGNVSSIEVDILAKRITVGATGYPDGVKSLHMDGTIDDNFRVSVDGVVASVLAVGDGDVVIGGSFSTVNGRQRPCLARLLPNGELDDNFIPNPEDGPDTTVHFIKKLQDGSLMIGGNFSHFGENDRNKIAKVFADGKLDTSFHADSLQATSSHRVTTIADMVIENELIGGQIIEKYVVIVGSTSWDQGYISRHYLS